MIIDNTWVLNYIKKHGNTIIIPKETKIIKSNAFDLNEDIMIRVEFEEGSQLETIESFAFRGVKIVNTIVLPKNIKRIEEYAFYGLPYSVCLDDYSSIEVCDSDFIFHGKRKVNVPPNLKKLELSGLIERLESITIPADSKLEDMQITYGVDKVILPNSQELLSTNEKLICALRLRENKIMVLYYKGEGLYYEIMNIKDQTILYSRNCSFISKQYI